MPFAQIVLAYASAQISGQATRVSPAAEDGQFAVRWHKHYASGGAKAQRIWYACLTSRSRGTIIVPIIVPLTPALGPMTNIDDADVEMLLRDASAPAVFLAACGPGQSSSKLGGLPDAPTDFSWPTWNDRPLAFIGQIDLAALPRLPGFDSLPKSGFLYFFYDQNQSTWGFDPKDVGSWRVVYDPASATFLKARAPAGLDSDAIYAEKFVQFELISSIPSLERLVPDLRLVSDEAFDLGQELHSQSLPAGPEHQIGGYPNPVQSDGMELEAQLASNGLYCGNSSGY